MRLLLDTRVWLWMISAEDRLVPEVRALLQDPKTELYLSAAAVWEIGIKHASGKVRYSGTPAVQVPLHIKRSGVSVLGIEVEHVLSAAALPSHHRDPFDRLMIAQAQAEQLTLATTDDRLRAYGIDVLDVTKEQTR